MPARKQHALAPRTEKKHNYARDILLALLGVVLVVAFFRSQSRFDFEARDHKPSVEVTRKIVFNGELNPKNLGLPTGELRPLENLLAQEGDHLRQIRIHVERQDRWAELNDQTELRFWCEMTLNDGRIVKSVICRCSRAELADRLTRRVRRDLAGYRDAAERHGKERIATFTNTM